MQRSLPKSNRRNVIVGSAIAAGVLIIGGGVAFAAVAKPFASGKQLLLDGLLRSSQATGQAAHPTLVDEVGTIQFQNINLPNMPASQAAFIAALNGLTMHFDIFYNPVQKQAHIALGAVNHAGSFPGNVWISENKAMFDLSSFKTLFQALLPAGLKVPKYLVTDASQSQAIQSFWVNASKDNASLTATEQKSLLTLEEILLNAIPDKYISRTGLTSVEIHFDQTGLEDILHSEVSAVYANKVDVVKAVTVLSAAKSSVGEANLTQLQQSLTDALNNQSESTMNSAISSLFHSGTVSLESTVIHISKAAFGPQTSVSLESGASMQDTSTGATFGVHLNIKETSPVRGLFQMPITNAANSETFSQWLQTEMVGPSGPVGN